jgi:hypothetical protein
LVPHLLQLVDSIHGGRPANSYLQTIGGDWDLTYDEREAFVFPSELLARRYAILLLDISGGEAWLPVPAPDRASLIGPHGEARCRRCGCTEIFACPRRCWWDEPGLCSECAKPDPIVAWTVYERPTDFPDACVARRTIGGTPTTDVLQHSTLDGLRALLPPGMTCIPRHAADPRSVVEVWL